MIDNNIAYHFVGQKLPKKPKTWRKRITGDELVQEVVPFISKVLGVNESQARVIFCWCLHTHYWWNFEYSPRLIFQNIPQDIDTSGIMSLIHMLGADFVITNQDLGNSAPLAIGDIFNPTMLLDYDTLHKEYKQQVDCIIEIGYKEYGSLTSGLCSYECFYPLCMVTKHSVNKKINDKIIIPLFYDTLISKEVYDEALLLKAKTNAFLKTIDNYMVNNTDETIQSVIKTWQPIYKIAGLISKSFYEQVVKDTLSIACECLD